MGAGQKSEKTKFWHGRAVWLVHGNQKTSVLWCKERKVTLAVSVKIPPISLDTPTVVNYTLMKANG